MKRIIMSVGTCASIVSLAFLQQITIWGRIIILFIGIASFFILITDDIKSQITNEQICHNKDEIKDAMKNLITAEGKICIMSRDLSWVDNEIKALLTLKKSDALIFAEKESSLTKKLVVAGVIVKYYGKLGFKPMTRFTVLRYNTHEPQVAIASMQHSIRKRKKFKHVIYETGGNNCKQDKWINSLAIDMITLCNLAIGGEEDDKTDTAKKTD